MPIIGSRRAILPGGVRDADALAYAAAAYAAGAPVSSNRFNLFNALSYNLKAVGAWLALDRLWLYTAEDAAKPAQALVDLKARATATAVNAPVLTANRGYLFNGTSSYLDTGFNPATGGVNYGRTDACFGVWVVTAPSVPGAAEIGNDYGGYSVMRVYNNATQRLVQINAITNATTPPLHNNNLTGCFHMERTSETTEAMYRNGVQEWAGTDGTRAIPNETFYVGAVDTSSTAGYFSTAQIGAAWMGKHLPDQAGFYNVLRAFMTAVGVP
jgi:hypothetical protein